MMTRRPLQCKRCKHFKGEMTCLAFPNRIPQGIYRELEKHNLILEEQVGGFVYEPQEEYVKSDAAIEKRNKEIISQHQSNKELLIFLILNEFKNQFPKIKYFSRINFFIKMPSVDLYEFRIQIDIDGEPVTMHYETIAPGTDIYSVSSAIILAEKILNKRYYIQLVIKTDKTYEYYP